MNRDILNKPDSISYFNTINFYKVRIKQFLLKRLHNNCLQDGWVCWGQCTNYLKDKKIYKKVYLKINIITDTKLLLRNIKHYCFFNINEIKLFLDLISEEYGGISFKIKAGHNLSFTESTGYTLHLEMKNTTRLKILWILCLIRHLYEFPFNVFLKDALVLKSDPEFENQHISNLLQLVASVASTVSYDRAQSLGINFMELVDLQTIKDQLIIGDKIYDIYKKPVKIKSPIDFLLPDSIRKKKKKQIYPISSFGYWFNFKDQEKTRLELYKKYYYNNLKQ